MKPRLIILSDLWGKEKSDWVSVYVELLKDKFEIQYYDCCKLGEIDKTDYTEDSLHSQFVNGGIEKAVENLLKAEKNEIDVLAFSIGGTIAWKAALKGLNVRSLFAVSSTRLRYEGETPNGSIKGYYGENDTNKPNNDWFEKHSIDFEIIKNQEHDFYTEIDCATFICNEILKKIHTIC
ncbi:alpha/beta hydrolase [Flavobacterium taihuense]|uniref:Alpha/beta hydrolase n=1 Tax=Flavobacterium taihuense TaxID=2857508 RepID=A0ABS6XZ55_9FLAO|nr:alpha/beta hydrolase [Flavobacterium taihuense]MBW4361937.1 alpha/beta hydrolase [Flavobacterium taihuense]